MEREIETLRAVLARRERGRGKRYTASLQEQIARAAMALRERGEGWHTIGRRLGIPYETVRRFVGAIGTGGFVPVEVIDRGNRGSLALVSPDGHRIEGLTVADAAELLRRLR